MSEFISIAKVGEIPDGEARSFPVNGRMVAVFNSAGAYYAIDDTCPHMGASLATGQLEDHAVTCPWHAWSFDVTNGQSPLNPRAKIETYPVRVEGEDIFVTV